MNLGLFGGTFDPIHLGHVAIAAAAREAVPLDEVRFLPCRRNPLKRDAAVAGAEDRCAMIRLALAGLPWARLDRTELDRPGDQPSYSWQTVAKFRHTRPADRLFWILGADQWNRLPEWARPDYLARSVTFVVFPRDEEPRTWPGFRSIVLPARHPASATAVRRRQAWEFLAPEVAAYAREKGLYAPRWTTAER
jgi:nicotinate-nucleotide adenylyltransferase